MSSILKQLKDDDIEAVRHLIRRDALSDALIADDVETRLGKKIGNTEAARAAVIYRYRRSAEYARWLKSWENRDADLRERIATTQQRLEIAKDLVKGATGEGFEQLSNHVQARLLIAAQALNDDELMEAMGKDGWLKNALSLVQMAFRDRTRKQGEELKAKIEDMAKGHGGGKGVDMKAVCDKVDEIMGLKK